LQNRHEVQNLSVVRERKYGVDQREVEVPASSKQRRRDLQDILLAAWEKMGGAGYKLWEELVEVMKGNLKRSRVRVHDAMEGLLAYHHCCLCALDVRRLKRQQVSKGPGSEPSADM
jgi:hypothetical protein